MKIALCIFATLFLSSCSTGGTQKDLKSRAAFELDCEANSLQIVELNDTNYGVRGCNKKAVYIKSCTKRRTIGESQECTWVLNSKIE